MFDLAQRLADPLPGMKQNSNRIPIRGFLQHPVGLASSYSQSKFNQTRPSVSPAPAGFLVGSEGFDFQDLKQQMMISYQIPSLLVHLPNRTTFILSFGRVVQCILVFGIDDVKTIAQ